MMSAAKYYEIMERPFQALCPERSGYMNIGLWPAPTVAAAQGALVDAVLATLATHAPAPRGLVEGGSGWGASRKHVGVRFPEASYVGINLSAEQVAAARAANARWPRTTYLHAPIEALDSLDLHDADAFFAVEAAIHFKGKDRLLKVLAERGVKAVALGEIVVRDMPAVLANPYLAPALHQCWSLEAYQAALTDAGFTRQTCDDVTAAVFRGMVGYAAAIDVETYPENPEILRQLQCAFGELAALAERGALAYVVIGASV